jgi:hypothetical protein
MARRKVLSGVIETVSVKQATQNNAGGLWIELEGSPQAVVDYLTLNRIPQSSVVGATMGTTCYLLIHK